jgi:hypothetical protein
MSAEPMSAEAASAALTERPALLRRTAAPAAAAAALGGWAAALAVRDPHTSGSWGFCPFLVLTGRPCPFCGGLRAVWDLEHGQLAAAVGSNLLVVLALPWVALGLTIWFLRRAAGDGSELPPWARGRTVLALLGITLAFGVLRLTPALAVLAP